MKTRRLIAAICVYLCLCLLPALAEEQDVPVDIPLTTDEEESDDSSASDDSESSEDSDSETVEADESWLLMLVNVDNPIPDDYEVGELVTLRGGQQVDRRILDDLQEMFDAARADGVYPIVGSGYRTHEKQVQLLEDKYQDYLDEGYSEEEAQELALEWVAMPGTSEHEVGFGIDINATDGSTSTEVYEWLAENAWQYGFILRYPEDKTEITGIMYEPWHYRYVGREHAKAIYESGLCLEEYIEMLEEE